MNTLEKVIAGRVRLLFGSPFFGTLAAGLQLKEAPDLDPPTMATDGQRIFFHPEFVKETSKAEIEGVLVHEVLHLVLLTHLRRGTRNPKLWNLATDYAINILVKDEGFTLPSGVLFDEKFRDWSAEKIYNYFQDNSDEQPKGNDWNIGGVMDAGTGGEDGKEGSAPQMSQSEIEGEVQKMKAKIQAAASAAKKAGKTSAGIDRLVDEVCNPRANWKEILQRFLRERAFNNWDYSKSHTRILHSYGIISPVIGGEKLGKLAIIVDTSGSVDEEQLAQFAGEISSILDSYECSVTVIYIDTKINRIDEYCSDDLPLQLHAVGGGGTLAADSYQYIAENLDDACAVVHYTDTYLADWDRIEQPHCPTLVACTEKHLARDIPAWAEIVDISE